MNKDKYTDILLQLKDSVIPKKAKEYLEELVNALIALDNTFFISNEAKLEIICTQMKKNISAYQQIPTVDAVTLIIKDNKTAKQLLIDSIYECVNEVHTLVSTHSKKISECFENDFSILENKEKIDFFDL